MTDLIERLRLGDGTSPDHLLLLEAADALEKSVECMCGICKLKPVVPSAAGDIRALKHRIHELEGELIGYKKIVADQDAMLEHQTARIVDLQDEIRNLTGEE